ncbi:MAG: undecaprenyldiphospho-muramoylpentapeptide beta-N-acetylglucosaminyltransferase [Pseudomonadota bacterium]
MTYRPNGNSLKVVLAAGGTGGHTFPAQALAETLAERDHHTIFMTDHRGRFPGHVVQSNNLHRLAITSPAGGLMAKAKCLTSLVKSYGQARGLLRALAPDVVVGFGGYPSAPTVFAAWRLGLPLIVHEQNARLGKTNEWMAKRSDRVAMSFSGGAESTLPITVTGNPVRRAVVLVREAPYTAPTVDGPFNLLVTGGSQGARALAQRVPEALERLREDFRTRLWVTLQCPRSELPAAKERLNRAGIASEVAEFFEDIAVRVQNSHLVVCRSGASSVCELSVAGRPAIFVPYPHHKDQQQLHNAKALTDQGGGWVIEESDLSAEHLAKVIGDLAARPAKLANAAAAARDRGVPDAAEKLADLVETVAGHAPGNGHPMREAAQ